MEILINSKQCCLIAASVVALAGCGGGSGGSTQSSSEGGFLPAASAQTLVAPSAPAIPDPAEIERMIAASGPSVPGARGAGTSAVGPAVRGDSSVTTKALRLGWNFVLPSHCVGTYIGGLYYVYLVGRDGSVTWSPDPGVIAMLAPVCSTGAGVGFYITSTNGANFTWAQLAVYAL